MTKRRAKPGESLSLGLSGNTFDHAECVLWPFATAGKSYGLFYPRGPDEKVYVHVWICEERHGPRPSEDHEAAHSCGNSLCFNGNHISWKTRKENQADRLIHGTDWRGEKHGNSAITEAQARDIKTSTDSISAAALRNNTSEWNAKDIRSGRRWAWL